MSYYYLSDKKIKHIPKIEIFKIFKMKNRTEPYSTLGYNLYHNIMLVW